MVAAGNVYIVDDEAIIRQSLTATLTGAGYHCFPFARGKDLVDALDYLDPGCVLLDINMPDLTGFHVQEQLVAQRPEMPIIFVTAAGSVSLAVDAMKKGACDFVEKPFRDHELVERIETAQAKLAVALRDSTSSREASARLSKLTARETEVMRNLLRGDASKTVAHTLQLSTRTVEMHRANIIKKTGVRSFAGAIQLALEAGMRPA